MILKKFVLQKKINDKQVCEKNIMQILNVEFTIAIFCHSFIRKLFFVAVNLHFCQKSEMRKKTAPRQMTREQTYVEDLEESFRDDRASRPVSNIFSQATSTPLLSQRSEAILFDASVSSKF